MLKPLKPTTRACYYFENGIEIEAVTENRILVVNFRVNDIRERNHHHL